MPDSQLPTSDRTGPWLGSSGSRGGAQRAESGGFGSASETGSTAGLHVSDGRGGVLRTPAMAGSDVDPDLLPTTEEQRWVVDGLARLVQSVGSGPFLRAPLLEAKPEYFPDPWSVSKAGIRRLLARILLFAHPESGRGSGRPVAELPELVVHVQPKDPNRREPNYDRPDGPAGRSLDAWLVESSRNKLVIGIELAALDDPLRTVVGLCRTVAHRICVQHRLVKSEVQHFDPMIDLCAVYLGFGVPALDAADWRRSPAPGQKPERTRQGAADTSVVAYALALLCVARGYAARGRRQIASELQANQALFFQSALRSLDAQLDPLDRLSLPPEESWPEPRDVNEILDYKLPAALLVEADEQDSEEALPEERGIVDANLGKPVFCVERSMARRVFKFAMGLAFFSSMAMRSMPDFEVDTGMLVLYGVSAVVALTGLGALFRERRCSDPKCDASLAKGAVQCPRCGGDIKATIRNPNERLEMEERFAAETEGEAKAAG